MLSQKFDHLRRLATEALKAYEFFYAESADRADAWEFTWSRERPGGNAYVSLAIIESGLRNYDFEVWAGADNGLSYARQLVRSLTNIDHYDSHSEGFVPEIMSAIRSAADRALSLSDTSLTQRYPI